MDRALLDPQNAFCRLWWDLLCTCQNCRGRFLSLSTCLIQYRSVGSLGLSVYFSILFQTPALHGKRLPSESHSADINLWPGPAELNSNTYSGAKNGNDYPTAPEAAWLRHLVLLEHCHRIFDRLRSDGVEQARTPVDMDAGKVCHIQEFIWTAVVTNGAATEHEFDRQSDQNVDGFPLYPRTIRQVTTLLYYWIWNHPDVHP